MNDPLLTERAPGALGRTILVVLFYPLALLLNWRSGFSHQATWASAKELIWPPLPVVTPPKLSIRAQQLWERVRDPNNWYAAHDGRTPQAMKELVDAGLVGIGGRVMKMGAFYVPMGMVPFQVEEFPDV